MVKRFDFIERTLFLIRKELSEKLPDEEILDDMILKAKEILKEIY